MTVSRQWVTMLSTVLVLGGTATAFAGVDQDAFRARFGNRLRLNVSTETGYVQDVLGTAIDLGYRPRSDEDFAELGRSFIDQSADLFGVSGAELSAGEVQHHQLSKIGSTDKVSVEYGQLAGSMSVKDASVCILFDLDGRILSVQNQTVPGAYAVAQSPSVTSDRALAVATRAFGHPVIEVRGNELAIVRHEGKAALVYLVELRSSDNDNGAPVQERLTIDARTGDVLGRENTMHFFTDLTGNVNGWASPGILPDKSSNPEATFNLDYVRVDSP
ncbi:MAG: PepSY domain-containing protein, partial [Planctomycetota bacterium]